MIDGDAVYFLDVFATGMNDGVWTKILNGRIERVVMALFPFVWNIFVARNNTNNFETSLWPNAHKKLCCVWAVADNNRAKETEIAAEEELAYARNNRTFNNERNKTEDRSKNRDAAHWEKRARCDSRIINEEIISYNRHDAEDARKEKAAGKRHWARKHTTFVGAETHHND